MAAARQVAVEVAELNKAVNKPKAASAVVLYSRPYTFGQTSSLPKVGQVD